MLIEDSGRIRHYQVSVTGYRLPFPRKNASIPLSSWKGVCTFSLVIKFLLVPYRR